MALSGSWARTWLGFAVMVASFSVWLASFIIGLVLLSGVLSVGLVGGIRPALGALLMFGAWAWGFFGGRRHAHK
jgi:hypothetical protein